MQFHQTNNNAGDVNNLIILNPEVLEEIISQEEMDAIVKEVDEMAEAENLALPKEQLEAIRRKFGGPPREYFDDKYDDEYARLVGLDRQPREDTP